jgi:23S rRNA (cytidine1920-2'-O)/16S rRNA (cytidine1409-2'-O)-methyltransferase
VPADAALVLKPSSRFVSRGGEKLAGALDDLGVVVEGRACLDVGASTGGFTDCLLQRGASRVYAVDVGRGQLDARLRADPRVVVLEGVNARYLPADALPERCALAVLDLSFISLVKVVPAILPHLETGGILLPLIKPQFEAGRERVGKGGVVRDEAVRRRVIAETVEGLVALGLEHRATCDSVLAGAAGNREAFAWFVKP